MLSVNLGLAALIPIAWALMALIHQMRPRWLSSVQPGIRWPYLLACLAIATVVLNGVMLLSTTVGEELSIRPQSGFWGFFIVIVLTSPIQAVAEEIFFRGYLLQALGSLYAKPWFGVVASSVLFALLHGTQNVPLFVDRPRLRSAGRASGVAYRRSGGWHCSACDQQCLRLPDRWTDQHDCSTQANRGNRLGGRAFDVGGFALFAVLAYALSRVLKLRTHVALS
jgi:hypothetical protein